MKTDRSAKTAPVATPSAGAVLEQADRGAHIRKSSAGLLATLVGIGVFAVVAQIIIQWHWLDNAIVTEAKNHGHQLLASASAIRTYVEEIITKRLQTRNTWDYFDVYVMASGYVTRRILESARKDVGNFVIRFASRHPLNEVNLATPFEREIIRFFEEHPEASRWEGVSVASDQRWYWVAKPRRFEQSCLRCHALEPDAPKEIRQLYRLSHGAPKAGEVIIDIAGVSITDSLAQANKRKIQSIALNAAMCFSFLSVIIAIAWQGYLSQQRFARQLAIAKEGLVEAARTGRTVLCHLSADGNILSISDLVGELLGVNSNQVVGQRFVDVLVSESDQQRGKALLEEIRLAGRASPQDIRLRSAGGENRWFSVSGCLVDLSPREKGFLISLTDIQEKKRSQEQAEKAVGNLTALLEALPTAVLVITENKEIVYVNSAGARLLGEGDRHSIIGRHCYDFHVRCSERRGMGCELTQSHQPAPIEFTLRTLSGQEVSALAGGTIIDWGGQTAFARVFMDIRELKAKEMELLQLNVALHSANRTLEELYQMAEAATKAKSEFLANMSHEIRTPLTAILGYTELLLSDAKNSEAFPQTREALEIIYRNGQYLLRLIEDILDLAKIEAGRLRVEKSRCHLPTLMTDILSLMRVRAAAKNLELTIVNEGPVPEYIETDPIRLRQILINLIGNAIKFTELGGVRVVVRTTQAEDGGVRLAFDVVDSGIGIPPEQLEKIFEPFHQVDSSATRRHGGSGLGLTISRRLARMLGGDITVRSTVGKGSTFTLTIDPGDLLRANLIFEGITAVQRQLGPLNEAKAEEIRFSGRILLAEDGPDNQRFFEFILRRAGAEVTLVEDGQRAVDSALSAAQAGQPFDLILMDMQMPVLDGYEATRRLRAAGYIGPIVALTAHAMEGAAEECLAAGCDDYIAKPVDRLAFLRKVAQFLKQGKPAQWQPTLSCSAG